MHTLYLLTFQNGKSYVGQTVRTLQTRIAQHRNSAKRGSLLPVHCAWRSHGEPEVKVIAEYATHEELHIAEIAAITAVGTLTPNGYNVSYGGETAPSRSPLVAKKIAERATGRKHSNTSPWAIATKANWAKEAYREKVSAGLCASWTEERRKEMSERSKAMWAKRKEAGWSMPELTKAKLQGRVFSEESRQKMSVAAKGKPKGPRSEETCARLSESIKRSWQDPEIRAKRTAAIQSSKEK
jgi:hypothetical protein